MIWRQLQRGLRGLLRRGAADRDIDDEVQDYFEQATAAQRARGLSPTEARRAARLELGTATLVREQVRASGWEHGIETTLADLRYAARRLVSAPGFTAVTALTLALGIGATTAIFSAVNPILFSPLPYPTPGRILVLRDYGASGAPSDVTFGTFRELAQRSRSFAALAVMKPWEPTLSGSAEPERLEGQAVTAGYFTVLGVPPALGRDFDPPDDRPHGLRTAIVSDGLWRRRFGADSGLVGRTIPLDGVLFTVIGVMPRGYENALLPGADIWTLLQYDAALPSLQAREWGHHLGMIARLRPGVRPDEARQEIAAIARTPLPSFARPPWASLANGLQTTVLRDDVTRGVRAALYSVLGAVLLLLAIASGNVTNLLLARGAERSGEFAVRAALGATRPRLVRQLLTESLLLSLLGGACGLAVAALGIRGLVALSPADIPRAAAIRLDTATYVFACVITMVIGLAVGLVPALQAARGDLHGALQDASRRTAGAHHLTRRTLVVAEVSLALVLLVGAGLLVHSLDRLLALPPGFDPAHVLTLEVQVTGPRYQTDSATNRFFTQALDAVRRVPGVELAGFTSQLPFSGEPPDGYGAAIEASGGNTQRGDPVLRYAVTPQYFDVLRIPVRAGRALEPQDGIAAPRVTVVSESYAKRTFHGQSPLGRRLHVGPDTSWLTIVGVVGDVKQTSLTTTELDAVYVAPLQWVWADQSRWLVARVRGGGSATSLAAAVKRAIWSVDGDQPIVRVASMDAWVAASTAVRRFVMIVFEAFACVALLLAATGIYGMLSGGVTERRREIGVRAALGASRVEIVALVVGQGMRLTGLGVVIGLIGAGLASRALVSLLFGVSPLDPLTYAGVTVLLGGVALAACGVPAWRAAQIDPAQTLRLE